MEISTRQAMFSDLVTGDTFEYVPEPGTYYLKLADDKVAYLHSDKKGQYRGFSAEHPCNPVALKAIALV